MTASLLLQTYAKRIRELRRANADVPEMALAPAFQDLLAGLVARLPSGAGLVVMPEYRQAGVGRPDIALKRTGAPARAFVELKAPSKPADPARWRDHDKRQFERFRELACWATCNFSEIRLFRRGEEIASATVAPEQWLRADRDDARAAKALAAHDAAPLLKLVETLALAAGQVPAAQDARHLAQLMAHSARLVRGIVQDRMAELREAGDTTHAMMQVRQEFRDVLYAHPEAAGYPAGDFDALFSAAFAQTLAFGLLLVREATGRTSGADAWRNMPAEHPLMRTALRVLSLDEVARDIGIGFEVMRDTIDSFAPALLAIDDDGRDPILYFYEDFLETFDPKARERYGVYYTPVEVVRYMAGALDRALRQQLGTQGLRDPDVTLLDPAAGTGTFLLGIADRVRAQGMAEGGAGMAALALRDLARRMFAFELLIGPYAVAHYRLHHALNPPAVEGAPPPLPLPRLGVYLADTLAAPDAASAIGPLGFVSEGIADERREANRIKSAQSILAIVGNPPYRRLEAGENRTLVGDWMDGIWSDLKEPVSRAGHGNQLNTFPELSVAFWRWAIWKVFEAENAPRRGVVAFIANRKFLTGWPYAGLRQMMRRRFDTIEIVDLRGDLRRGERAGVESDTGVFNIQVGTAIVVAAARGGKAEGALADVIYRDSWAEGRFSRKAKLDWLDGGAEAGTLPGGVAVARGEMEDFRPRPFQSGRFSDIRTAFVFFKSGMKSGKNAVFINPKRSRLKGQFEASAFSKNSSAYDISKETYFAYRPLDRRWFYNDMKALDRPGPELQAVWGTGNVCLYAMQAGTGEGPAVWCHGLLPDYDSFRARGGYAFPLHDRRAGGHGSNISEALAARLGIIYDAKLAPEDIFDAILCLLSAASYTSRFAEDLEDVFPHVPFPALHGIFRQAVALGRDIRAVETFARPAAARHLRPALARMETEPRGPLAEEFAHADGAITLCADGSGRVSGIPQAVWTFAVSGYRLLPHWLAGRAGLPADLALARELRDICGRIAELIELFAQADKILSESLADPLGRGQPEQADDEPSI